MGVAHYGHIFDVDGFVEYVSPLAQQVDCGGADVLLSTVRHLLASSDNIFPLAYEYGWDPKSVLECIEEDRQRELNPHLVGWYFSFVIYHHFEKPWPPDFGFRSYFDLMQKVLRLLQWNASDISNIINGRKFLELAQNRLYTNKAGEIPEYWRHISTGSTASSIGWLDFHDVVHLKQRLLESQDQLTSVIEKDELEIAQQVFEWARVMLTEAEARKRGLCIIKSG
jgi:hypothetical protein